ncbi:MAG TPA: hypothetical protein VIQ77_01375 [Mucilaginibacter sp.]|jgi:hypothetical protein
MMKRYCLPLLLMLGLGIAKCKIDEPDLSSIPNTTDGYQPLTKGSAWTYHQVSSTGASMDEVMEMNGSHTVINGKTYYAVTDKADSSTYTSYFYHGDGSYSIRSAVLGGGKVVEYLYLKDNVVAGQTWTAPITDDGKLAGFPAQIAGKIVKQDTSLVISSITFQHVVHTQLQLQYDTGTGFETSQLIDFYIAKGAGIIKIDTDAGQPTNITSHQEIISCKIEK